VPLNRVKFEDKLIMYIDYINSPVGIFKILADEDFVISLAIVQSMRSKNENEITQATKAQLKEYFLGQRKGFDLPIKLVGTSFQKSVWKALLKIPYGNTCSYEDIAKEISNPKSYRAVGTSNKANKLPIIIPCHRVIAKNGDLAGFALGKEVKSWLITHEICAINKL
jgi:methylated-DNA-[protein]-cysteine S-methyltransferase